MELACNKTAFPNQRLKAFSGLNTRQRADKHWHSPAAISAFRRVSGSWKRYGSMQLQHRNDNSAALDEGPVPAWPRQLQGVSCQLKLIHPL